MLFRKHENKLKLLVAVTTLTLANIIFYFSFELGSVTVSQTSDVKEIYNKSEENLHQFWQTVRSQFGNDALYPRTFDVREVTTVLRQGKILYADLFLEQTSFKLKLIYEGNQSAIFKVLLIDRENKSRQCNNGCEHPEYEVVAFTLNRMFDLRNMPYVTGRNLSWYKELEPVASPRLKNYTQVQKDSSICFEWPCLGISLRRYCFKNGVLPGAVIYFIEDKEINYIRTSHNLYHAYYILGIHDKRNLMRLPGDKEYCLHFRSRGPYRDDALFMDIVDIAVLDYLLSHMDAKHTYLTKENDSTKPDFNIMIDYGHAFCKIDTLEIMAPLLQCCRFRKRLWKTMNSYRDTFKEAFVSLTKDDPLHPLLLPELLDDLNRKLKQTLALMDFCRNLDGDSEVIRDV